MEEDNTLYTLSKEELTELAKKAKFSFTKQQMVIDFFYYNVRPLQEIEEKYNLKSSTLRNYKCRINKKLLSVYKNVT